MQIFKEKPAFSKNKWLWSAGMTVLLFCITVAVPARERQEVPD